VSHRAVGAPEECFLIPRRGEDTPALPQQCSDAPECAGGVHLESTTGLRNKNLFENYGTIQSARGRSPPAARAK